MSYRAMKRVNDQWQKVEPENLSRWLYANDGEEAVVIEDGQRGAKTYYCGRPEMMQQYRDAWESERKVGDKRTEAMFIDLDRQLFAKETPIMPDQSPAYCKGKGCLCSEIFSCSGACL
jgi:hypothetical protein